MNITESVEQGKLSQRVDEPERFTFEIGDLNRLQIVLNRYCLSITGSRQDAEDLAQDTWLKSLMTLNISGHANPEALLLRTAKHIWIDKTRRKAALANILRRERFETAAETVDEVAFELEAVFQMICKHLSSLQRTVFLLKDVFGYSLAETADILGTTEGAVKSALHRARQSLLLVRDEIERNVMPSPKDEGMKAYLQALVAAYRLGDATALVELAGRDEVEPAVAVGIVRYRISGKSFAGQQAGARKGTGSTVQMAA
ncbi:RNA polymerase sigma factor [Paenibacillus thalictri]|uniref:RNA polymerase sigma factor n=1 Tax=Paenibacillus thalictri TaxID=2527873 RepID=A0A4Q9DVA7_9BACL|nr:RNA polymerase sigma factor [Paenibacillus thalictri]TBL80295.1 RNA polymerase sigma factor [Paenibacillus thalictri]